jgi:hypothetical protein
MTILLAALLTIHLQLEVRLYDSVGVPPADLDRARVGADAILASVGINPIWRPCNATTCVGKPKPREIEIRLVNSTPLSQPGSLGFSAIDVDRRAGTIATVYLDRVDALADQAGTDRRTLLARVVAHEVGHLLLGRPSHSPTGLMRATWRSTELQRDMPLDWLFSAQEGAEMRRRLLSRPEADDTPIAIVASIADAEMVRCEGNAIP